MKNKLIFTQLCLRNYVADQFHGPMAHKQYNINIICLQQFPYLQYADCLRNTYFERFDLVEGVISLRLLQALLFLKDSIL